MKKNCKCSPAVLLYATTYFFSTCDDGLELCGRFPNGISSQMRFEVSNVVSRLSPFGTEFGIFREFSTFSSFGCILWMGEKLQDDLMGQRKFQISKVVQDRNLIREIRVFRVPVEFSSMVQC